MFDIELHVRRSNDRVPRRLPEFQMDEALEYHWRFNIDDVKSRGMTTGHEGSGVMALPPVSRASGAFDRGAD